MTETSKNPLEFSGKVAVVSGAAQGIGRAVTLELARRGAKVAALDIESSGLGLLTQNAEEENLSILTFCCDVTNSLTINNTIDAVAADLGSPTLLANIAGIMRAGDATSMTDKDWTDTLAVNASGVMYLSRRVAQSMRETKSGSIVTVTSNAASVARRRFAAYAASKAAATMYTKCLGLELAADNIRCNIVSPGSTDTQMLHDLLPSASDLHQVLHGSSKEYRVGIPLMKISPPQAVASAVLYLLSDAASHITLADIRVDGGATLGA